jgi:hypothetical protein
MAIFLKSNVLNNLFHKLAEFWAKNGYICKPIIWLIFYES